MIANLERAYLQRLHRCAATGKAFSVIELLMVVAVMSVLLALTVPFTSAQSTSGRLNDAILGSSLMFEQARAHALSNRTYVWLGFNDNPASGTLTIAVVAGASGSEGDIHSAATFRPLMKPKTFRNIRMSSVTGLAGMSDETDSVENSTIVNFHQVVGGHPMTFTQVIQFTPSGGVQIDNEAVSRWVQVGMQSLRGTVADPNNKTAFQIAGLTGQVRIFRNDILRQP